MICPNCGRRNPAGATFCSRCRQRLPLAAKYGGSGYRRAAIAEPTGGGSGGALVLVVALLALFLFIGGGAYIFLSTPQLPQNPGNGPVANASATPTLPAFVQETPTAAPTPVPSPTEFQFSFDPGSPSASFSELPTFTIAPTTTPTYDPGNPTPTTTRTPRSTPTQTRTPRPTATNTNQPTPTPAPKAKFTATEDGLKVKFTNTSSNATSYTWEFGDGGTSTQKSPSYTYAAANTYSVKLTVTGPGGSDEITKPVTVDVAPSGPQAKLSCSSTEDLKVSCDASASIGDNLSYAWTSDGDPGSASGPTQTFMYALGVTPAHISVTVTDSSNATDTANKTVDVQQPPPPIPGETAIQPLVLAIFGLALPFIRRRNWKPTPAS